MLKIKLNDPEEVAIRLNEANQAYYVESMDGVYRYQIGDLECLRISNRMQKQKRGEKYAKLRNKENHDIIYLALEGLSINISTMEAYFENSNKKRKFCLVKNIGNKRIRSKYSRKFHHQTFDFKKDTDYKDLSTESERPTTASSQEEESWDLQMSTKRDQKSYILENCQKKKTW